METNNARSRKNAPSSEINTPSTAASGHTGPIADGRDNGKSADAAVPSWLEARTADTDTAPNAAQKITERRRPAATLGGNGLGTGGHIRPTPQQALQETFLDERDDVLAVVNELEDQLDRYQEIRSALERDLRQSTEQLQGANQRIQELEWQVVTLQTRADALEQVRQEIAVLEEEIAEANRRAQRTQEELNQAEKETARLTNEVKACNKQLEELWAVRKERDGLRADAKTLRHKLEEQERAQRDYTEERALLQAKLQEAQISLEDTRAARHQIEIEGRAAEERSRESARVQELLEEKLETLRNEKKNMQAQLTHLERENSRLAQQQQFYECELTSLRSTNRNAETALSNVKKAFAEVRVALSETKARARRRTIEAWPRLNAALDGLDNPDEIESNDDGPIAAAVPADGRETE